VKDLPSLIDAFDELRRRLPQSHLVIAGDGPERARLELLIRDRELRRHVSLLGHRDDVRQILPALDVYANSSVSEGISITILEAMAAGIPVLATNVGGTPEIITDGTDGVLVPARRADILADMLIALAGAPLRRADFGAAGRLTVERRFRVDAMVDAYAQVYAELGGD
jgi:glycosyltransferase involved in cell wall biosynthesis